MLTRFSVLLLVGLTEAAVAADATGDASDFPADSVAATAPVSVLDYGVDTPIESLAANPAAAAIVEANIPGLLENSQL